MSEKKAPGDIESARGRAQKYFAASEERENQIKQTIENERAKQQANTAKLRALRLAKEEADRVAAANAPVETPKLSTRKAAAKSKATRP